MALWRAVSGCRGPPPLSLRALAPSLAGRPPLQGPHASRECLPLSLILRDRLKYALTRKESLMIVMKKSIKVDGKVR